VRADALGGDEDVDARALGVAGRTGGAIGRPAAGAGRGGFDGGRFATGSIGRIAPEASSGGRSSALPTSMRVVASAEMSRRTSGIGIGSLGGENGSVGRTEGVVSGVIACTAGARTGGADCGTALGIEPCVAARTGGSTTSGPVGHAASAVSAASSICACVSGSSPGMVLGGTP